MEHNYYDPDFLGTNEQDDSLARFKRQVVNAADRWVEKQRTQDVNELGMAMDEQLGGGPVPLARILGTPASPRRERANDGRRTASHGEPDFGLPVEKTSAAGMSSLRRYVERRLAQGDTLEALIETAEQGGSPKTAAAIRAIGKEIALETPITSIYAQDVNL